MSSRLRKLATKWQRRPKDKDREDKAGPANQGNSEEKTAQDAPRPTNASRETSGSAPPAVQASRVEQDHKDPYGLKFLAGPGDEDAASQPEAFDIVAIHGIDGNAWETWQHANGSLWLSDFLPTYFPSARVYSFGYQADVAFTKGRGNLRTFSRQLLAGLNSVRYNEALVTAAIDKDDYGPIRAASKCVMFLSTPHRGSDVTPWPKLLSNVGKIAVTYTKTSGFLGNFRNDLIELLEKNSQDLSTLNIEFRNQHKGIVLVSLYETRTTPPFKEPVIDETTGVMGVEGEIIVPLDGTDHHTVCRFPSETSNFRLVLAQLQRIVPDKGPLNDDEKAFLKTLTFEGMMLREGTIEPPLEQTCEWFFRTTEYLDWRNGTGLDKNKGILWLKGKPGSGKSTIMKHAVNRVVNDSQHLDVVLTFYFDARGKTPLQKNSLGMYRSLIHQLLSKNQHVPASLMKRYFGRKDVVPWAEWMKVELREMLTECLMQQKPAQRTIILVDALDECGEDEIRETLDRFYEVAKSAVKERKRLGFCFSSRHYPSITLPNCLELRTEHNNEKDIQSYISAKLEMLHPPLDPRKGLEELRDALKSRAANVFLWLILILPRVLAERKKGKSLKWLLSFVKETPDDLTTLFKALFDSLTDAEERKRTLSLFQWVVFSGRSLTLDSLRYALAFTSDNPPESISEWEDSPDYLEPGMQFELVLIDRSRGLVEVTTSGARLIHATVEDFLLTRGGFQILDASLAEDFIGKSHLALFNCCVAFLGCNEILSLVSPGQRKKTTTRYSDYGSLRETLRTPPPLTTYSVEKIGHHMRKSAREDKFLDELATPRNIKALQNWLRLLCILVTNHHREHTLTRVSTGSPQLLLLFLVCQGNMEKEVSLLLKESINVDKSIEGLGSFLVAACDRSIWRFFGEEARIIELSLVTRLTQSSQNATKFVNGAGINGSTALHLAVTQSSMPLVELFIKHQANVNCVNRRGETPLYIACSLGALGMVNLLLANRADVGIETQPKSNLLTAAVVGGNEEVMDLILGYSPSLDLEDEASEYGSPLCASFMTTNSVAVVKLLEKGANLWDPFAKRSPFECTGFVGRQSRDRPFFEDIVGSMALRGMLSKENVNNKDCKGNAIIHYAVQWDCRALVLLLVCGLGCDIDIPDSENLTPFQIAAGQGNTGMVHLLILNGATITDYPPTPRWPKVQNSLVHRHSGLARYIHLLREGKSPEEALEATWELSVYVENWLPTDPGEYFDTFVSDEVEEIRSKIGQILYLRHIIEGLSYLDALYSSRMGEQFPSVRASPPFGHLKPWRYTDGISGLAREVLRMKHDPADTWLELATVESQNSSTTDLSLDSGDEYLLWSDED